METPRWLDTLCSMNPAPMINRRSLLLSMLAPCLCGCLPIPATGPEPALENQAANPSNNENNANAEATVPPLQAALDHALDYGFGRQLSFQRNGAWQILHGVLAYGLACKAITADGENVPVVDYLQNGGKLEGFTPLLGDTLQSSDRRGIRFEIEAGSMSGQGHQDQWLAVLSQTGLPSSAEFRFGERVFTLDDVVEQTLWDVPRNLEQEYSWTVIGLTAYRPIDFAWTARDGNRWSIEQLVDIEANGSMESAACGGTHRLIGLAMSLQRHRDNGGKPSPAWENAKGVIEEAIASARAYQNGDGSFSTTYLYRYGWSPDLADVLRTTGHVLEFLSIALDPKELAAPWVEAAAWRLCEVLKASEQVELECGALYHALHGVVLYRQRRFPESPWLPPQSQHA